MHSRASAECSSFCRKQLEHLVLWKILGANFLHCDMMHSHDKRKQRTCYPWAPKSPAKRGIFRKTLQNTSLRSVKFQIWPRYIRQSRVPTKHTKQRLTETLAVLAAMFKNFWLWVSEQFTYSRSGVSPPGGRKRILFHCHVLLPYFLSSFALLLFKISAGIYLLIICFGGTRRIPKRTGRLSHFRRPLAEVSLHKYCK